jgi:PadR family transcriptional regulator PadR
MKGMADTEAHLRKFHKELSAGIVSLVLLAVLARAKQPMYGYQIAKQFEETGEGVLSGKQSALYPVLRNLSAAGLLVGQVEPSVSGPPRRYYRITTLDRRVLDEWTYAGRIGQAPAGEVGGLTIDGGAMAALAIGNHAQCDVPMIASHARRCASVATPDARKAGSSPRPSSCSSASRQTSPA